MNLPRGLDRRFAGKARNDSRTTRTTTTIAKDGEDEATVANSERISQMIASGSVLSKGSPAHEIGKRTKAG
ncbi:hypothetical protein TWF281_007691 [Arthrobotrys megalospora]